MLGDVHPDTGRSRRGEGGLRHYGDVTKLSGYDLPVVDVITGGSPCQDLSIAKGNRDGLSGDRSGLFMEQIRIVKEMRERDKKSGRTGYLIRPRFMVWENVPGAFSSNKGKDFQTVLTEIVRIIEPDAPDVPLPRSGKWPHSGCLYDELGVWSIAWRVHDAQFWGVPQRRKRIALVADFGGRCASEVLFERKGLCRDIEESGEKREGPATGVEESTDNAISFQERAGKPGGVRESSYSENTQEPCPHSTSRKCSEPVMIEMTSTKNTIIEGGVSHTLTQRMGTGGNQVNAIWREDELRISSVRGLQGVGAGEFSETERLQGCD